jgi:hypothetical protein
MNRSSLPDFLGKIFIKLDHTRVRSTAWAEICSSTTAPCVVLPPASMQSCNLCIHAIHGVHAGGTTPWTGEVERGGNTRSRAMPPQGWSKDRAIAECVPFRRQTVRTAYPTKQSIRVCRSPSDGMAKTDSYAKKEGRAGFLIPNSG